MDKNSEINSIKMKDQVLDVVKTYMQSGGFTDRKITDTPNDTLATVNRKYVNLNGTTPNRPTSSVLGQFYFDTTLNKPIWWRGDAFVDAAGNVV